MKNEVAVSEYDMIGAELYYCYNYFENVNKINKQLNKINDNIYQNDMKGNEYSIENIKENSNIDWSKYPEIKEGYKAFYESYLERDILEREKTLNACKNEAKLNLILLIITILFLVIGFCLWISTFVILLSETGKSDGEFSPLYLMPLIGFILVVICILILVKSPLRKCVKDSFSDLRSAKFRSDISSSKKYDDLYKHLEDSEEIKFYINHHISNTEAVTIFRKNEQKLLSDLEEDKTKTRQYLLSKTNENKIVLNSLKDEFQSNMSSRSTIIPSVYHNEEDIKNLIDYYVRRRGDTWKELVNEYEHDKKLNQIISSIDNLSNQVNILTNGVVQCFNIIGQQLGIINQSVNSLQVATSINLDRISEIENQQERRLCELTSSIQNMNKQTKVIIESK